MPRSELTKVKVDMAELKQKVVDLCENFVEFKDQYHKDTMEIKAMLESYNDRFAAKWAENAWVWLFGVIGVVIVGYLIRVVLSHGWM